MYASNIQSAYNLIAKKGLSVTINYKTATSYDVSTGLMTVSSTSMIGYAVVVKNSLEQLDTDKEFVILLSARGINKPSIGDAVVMSGDSFVIRKIDAIAPNYDEPILYKVELRR